MLERIKEEVSKYFKTDIKELSASTVAQDVDGWDSLEHSNFLIHLESLFSIEFSLDELIDIENLGLLAECIEKKLNK